MPRTAEFEEADSVLEIYEFASWLTSSLLISNSKRPQNILLDPLFHIHIYSNTLFLECPHPQNDLPLFNKPLPLHRPPSLAHLPNTPPLRHPPPRPPFRH